MKKSSIAPPRGKVSGTRKIPSLETSDEILIAAHGNSLRGIIKYLKNHSGRRNHTSQSADCRTVYI